ncbi:MAG TPA: hypothetical protein VND19_06100 [Acetobacteraceae bacterium]|nr:hypothetical protein [Acetobacteraceae bacterium]
MGKLRLLLSAGAMLSLVAGAANAARILGMQGNPATVTGTGLVNQLSGFQQMGSPYTGGQGLEIEPATPWSVPAPGTINMRVNSFVNEFPMYTSFTGMNGAGTPGSNAGNKIQGYGIYGWIRIDLGLDGMTKNGIKYGAYTQIRENNTTAPAGGTLSGATNSGFATNPSVDSLGNTLYVRHANVYIGTDQLGFIKIGTGIAAQTLFETGLNDNFDIGGWISFDGTNIPANMGPVWPWADEGGEYMAARLVYVSPVIAGFDAGIAFAPNNSTPFDGSGCSTGYGGVGCVTQSSSTFAADQGRYRNELGLALRYRNAFGPIGLAVAGIYTTSGKVNAVGPQVYNGENIGDIGASVSVNHVWSIGGNVMFGAFNGNWGLQNKPVGLQTSTTQAVAWEAGTKYTFLQVPLTIGTYYFNYKYQGQPGIPTQRTSQGIDVGAVYGMGPGVVLIAEYAWGQNYQGDYNFLTGATGTSAGNKVTAQVATLGMSVRF